MGKARILEAHGEGRYTIEIVEARERAESAKQQAEARIQTLTAEVNQLDAKIQTAQQAVDLAAIEQNAAIEQRQQEVAEEGSSTINLAKAAEKVMAAAGERDTLRAEKRSKELRITADQALVARINSLPPLRQMQAWCADYTEDLSGDVATAEVPGEVGSVIIKPGHEGANQWSAATDGAMQPALAGTPASVFYNLAMQPGWQKWRPTYRTATITSIDGDTCSIALDTANSSQQGLNINAQSSYSGVPILYMNCDGSAFEAGDRVLVAFAGNVEGPTVVGFESQPKQCSKNTLIIIPLNQSRWYYDPFSYNWPELYEAKNPESATDLYLEELDALKGMLAAYNDPMHKVDFLLIEADVAYQSLYTYRNSEGELITTGRVDVVHPIPDFATFHRTSRFSYRSSLEGNYYSTLHLGALIDFYEAKVNNDNGGIPYKEVIIAKFGVSGYGAYFSTERQIYVETPPDFLDYLQEQGVSSIKTFEYYEHMPEGRWMEYAQWLLPQVTNV